MTVAPSTVNLQCSRLTFSSMSCTSVAEERPTESAGPISSRTPRLGPNRARRLATGRLYPLRLLRLRDRARRALGFVAGSGPRDRQRARRVGEGEVALAGG